jgi:hypothetical protein
LDLRGRKWQEAGEDYNEEGHNLCASPHIIRVGVKPRRMRWVRHVACMGEMTDAYKILIGKT